jgi:ribosomal protein S18 acetylase RimI-like enzyme
MRREEITYYLDMPDAHCLRPTQAGAPVDIRHAEVPCPDLNRFLYAAVGGDWYWIDRLPWTYQQWLDYLSRPGHETWVAYVSGTPAGYFELDDEAGGPVELAYFGLLPQFTGRGLGGHLLTAAVERAWAKGATRVWVHTSSLDHPRALANYQARGFRLVRQASAWKELPDRPPGPWPGADRGS